MNMLAEKLSSYHVVLGSQSPRRSQLLNGLAIPFEIRVANVDEDFPQDLQREKIAEFLAELKNDELQKRAKQNELIITADTIVWKDKKVWNKPADRSSAIDMLRHLMGDMHEVISGVCIQLNDSRVTFHDLTKVYFREFSKEELAFYVDNYEPFDKAGSYGAQDWLGYVGIERLEGSFYNVMGLPVHKVYRSILEMLESQ